MTNRSTASGRRITMERHYPADLRDVWDLWTTKEGFESWWGPGGFAVTVRDLDLRPGGTLAYTMRAVDPAMVEYMKSAGMPITTEAQLTWTEIVPHQRLGYVHLMDFIPGVEPYDVATEVRFERTGNGVRMIVTFDTMHSEEWTTRASMGWESQLAKLDAMLADRAARSAE